MKKLVVLPFIFLVMICIFSPCFSTVQESFLQAQVAYQKSDFKKAIALYQSINNKGAIVWFNLGNCYYHCQQYVDALACWKRSLKYGGNFLLSSINDNCDQAYQRLGLHHSTSFMKKSIEKINGCSLFLWQMIFLLLWILFLGNIVHFSKKNYVLVPILLFSLMSLSGACLGVKYWNGMQEKALVKKECPLFAGTDERFSKIAILVPGLEVTVKEKRDIWCKVQSNDHLGWILMAHVDYI